MLILQINQNTIFQKLCLSGEEEFGHISISTRQVTEREKDYEEESEEDELEDIDREEDDESDGEQSIASEGEEDEGEECDIVPNPKRQRVGDDKGQVFKLGDIVSICGDNERCRYYVDEILVIFYINVINLISCVETNNQNTNLRML